MYARALAMKISSLTVSGMPYFSMNSRTESSSWASMKSWPSMSIGSSPGTILTLSTSESISLRVVVTRGDLGASSAGSATRCDMTRRAACAQR